MQIAISDIEHARMLEASMRNIVDTQDVKILRSTLIRYYAKNNYVEDLMRLIAEPDLLFADDSYHILSALIDSNRIKESEIFVARLDDVMKSRWDIRIQLARLNINTGRFDTSLAISKALIQEDKEDPDASGLLMLSLIRLDRYSDLFEYIESASERALSPDWAVLAFAHEYNFSSHLDTPRMLRAIEKISKSRAKDYRLWSVRLKRMAGFFNQAIQKLKASGPTDFLDTPRMLRAIKKKSKSRANDYRLWSIRLKRMAGFFNEAMQELKAYGPTELLEEDYDNELNLISSVIVQHASGDKSELLKRLLPQEKIVRPSQKIERLPETMTAEQIEKIISNNNLDSSGCIVMSVSHDHYKNNSGGIQLCIQIEERQAIQQGWCYLNVHPWQPLQMLASEHDNPDPVVSLILNGQCLGFCYSSVLTIAIHKVTKSIGIRVYPVIHSLIGHSINHVKEWVKLNKNQRWWIWLHDFFTLCPSHTLQRNNVSFCNAPVISSNACNICNYGAERISHLESMRDLFSNMLVTVISPSEFTKNLWLSKADYLNLEVKVLPHMELKWFNPEKVHSPKVEKPISIGFLGGRVYHKGWFTFEKLVNQFSTDSRFKFYYFGNNKYSMKGVQNININVSTDNLCSMVDAISEMEIDFVLHWAMWPETFSFTAHEAIAGGAHVLTNPISGNVATVVMKTGRGTILSNEDELLSFFSQGQAEEVAKTIRSLRTTHGCQPSFSQMTIPLLIKEHSLS